MNVMLQAHGAKRIFPVPEGLRELISDIAREVLRSQPPNMYGFIADYLDAMILTRDSAALAAQLVGDMLDGRINYQALWKRRGTSIHQAERAAVVIQSAFRGYQLRRWLQSKCEEGEDWTSALRRDKYRMVQAVITLQAAARGYLTRKSLRQQRESERAGRGDHDESLAATWKMLEILGIPLAVAERAARTLQRSFRSYVFRKSLAGAKGVTWGQHASGDVPPGLPSEPHDYADETESVAEEPEDVVEVETDEEVEPNEEPYSRDEPEIDEESEVGVQPQITEVHEQEVQPEVADEPEPGGEVQAESHQEEQTTEDTAAATDTGSATHATDAASDTVVADTSGAADATEDETED